MYISLVSFGVSFGCGARSSPSELSSSAPPRSAPQEALSSEATSTSKRGERVGLSAEMKRAHLAPTRRAALWSLGRSHSSSPSAQEARGEPSERSTHRITVAALLPLSGRYQKWGEEVRGSLLRYQPFAPHITWEVIDIGGSSGRGAAEVDRAVLKLKAQALIGPLSPWSSAAVSARARWYETPWFPLGSFPSMMRHPFSLTWRLEASDVAEAIAQEVCRRAPQRTLLLVSERPRAQVTARRLSQRLRRCGLPRIKAEPISVYIEGEGSSHASAHRLSARLGLSDPDSATSARLGLARGALPTPPALITLARGAALSRLAQLLVEVPALRPTSTRSARSAQQPNKLMIYAGLGSSPPQSLRRLNVQFHSLERPPLSSLGRRVLRETPTSSTLSLELLDLTLWLEEAAKVQRAERITFVQALGQVRALRGAWGRREVRRGALAPPKLIWSTKDRER